MDFVIDDVQCEMVNSMCFDNQLTNELMAGLDIEILHIQTPSNKFLKRPSNGITIAYRRNTRGKSVEIATAVCSKHDQYNKRIGKQIAVARFMNGQSINVPFSYHTDTRQFLCAMFQYAD